VRCFDVPIVRGSEKEVQGVPKRVIVSTCRTRNDLAILERELSNLEYERGNHTKIQNSCQILFGLIAAVPVRYQNSRDVVAARQIHNKSTASYRQFTERASYVFWNFLSLELVLIM
jgi:hypothetical protein